MIKSDRFWHRIIKFKTVAGLRRSLNCDFPPSSTLDESIEWHGKYFMARGKLYK